MIINTTLSSKSYLHNIGYCIGSINNKKICCGIQSNLSCGKRKFSREEIELKQRSKQIDSELKVERKKRQHQVRLLLLGAGESGI